MLNLTLWNDAGNQQFNVDLYKHEPVNLTFQFADVSEINKTKGSHSQTFRIPATKTNVDYFGSIFNASVHTDGSGLINGNYDVKKKIKAQLKNDTIVLMTGFVQLKAVYLQKKDFADFELIFFGEIIDLAKSLGDSELQHLDTTAIDHTLNMTNVQSSWVVFLSGNIRYGLIDKGRNWSFADTPPFDATNGLWLGDFTPFVRMRWLIDAIMLNAGFTYSSAFFDSSYMDNVYIPAYNGSITPVSDNIEPEQQRAGAGLAVDFNLTSSYVLAPLVDTVTGGFDYNANFASNKYTAPHTGFYTITVNQWATVFPVISETRFMQNTTVIATHTGQGKHTIILLMLTGDTFSIESRRISGTGGVMYAGGGVGDGGATWLRIDSVSEPLMGQSVDMSKNLPEIKQIDFLTSVQKMYNLVFVPDVNKPNHLIIEPFKDYIATGTKKDWSSKLDYSKDVIIKPTTDIQRQRYDWTYSAGGDFINDLIQKSTGRVYGRYRVQDGQNDFATGEQSITNDFAPYLMSYIPNSQFQIHRCIDKDGVGVKKPKVRVAFWNSLTTGLGDLHIRNDAGATTTTIYFPLFSNYSHWGLTVPTISDEDLNYGYERAFIYTNGHPLHTLYYKYWMNFVNELYSNEARILVAFFKLELIDIHGFEFSDNIYIRDSYYRILSIENYDATSGGVVKVTMLKILSDIADCGQIPTSVNNDGTIRFNNTFGNYGNKTCCEKYGYIWRPRLARCFTTPSTAQPV